MLAAMRACCAAPCAQDEYPGYNFIGMIIGPRGKTQVGHMGAQRHGPMGQVPCRWALLAALWRLGGGSPVLSNRQLRRPLARARPQKRLEAETGARVAIRGRGSVKEGRGARSSAPGGRLPDSGEDEDLHVHITAEDDESLNKVRTGRGAGRRRTWREPGWAAAHAGRAQELA